MRCSLRSRLDSWLPGSVRRCAGVSVCNLCLPLRCEELLTELSIERRSAELISDERGSRKAFSVADENRFRFGARFDQLAFGEILLGKFDSLSMRSISESFSP